VAEPVNSQDDERPGSSVGGDPPCHRLAQPADDEAKCFGEAGWGGRDLHDPVVTIFLGFVKQNRRENLGKKANFGSSTTAHVLALPQAQNGFVASGRDASRLERSDGLPERASPAQGSLVFRELTTWEKVRMRLYGYWRSSATFRVRVALNLKSVAVEEMVVDLDTNAHLAEEFARINPQCALPALVDDGTTFTQSLAILEYLEERYPDPPILPRDFLGRARVRALASICAADSHPLITPRVRKYLAAKFGATPEQWKAWQTEFYGAGLRAIEARLAGDPATGRFCHGDTPTMADLCLLSIVIGRDLFRMDIPGTPTVDRIAATCWELDAFARAHPSRQVDAPKAA
jgi:maleylacetoacetate isomerase